MQPLNSYSPSFQIALLAIATGDPRFINLCQPHIDALPDWLTDMMFEESEKLRSKTKSEAS